MTKKLEESITEVMEMYRRKIAPDNKGWKVLSIEYGPENDFDGKYRQFGVGNDYNAIDLLSGAVIPTAENGNGWDLIIISQVIQYVLDFKDLIKECYDLLNPGGFLIVDCPFIKEYDHKGKYEEYWRVSHKALQNVLNDIGFEHGNCGLINEHLTSALARKGK
jgi:SAM-dependent methyltransferase